MENVITVCANWLRNNFIILPACEHLYVQEQFGASDMAFIQNLLTVRKNFWPVRTETFWQDLKYKNEITL